MEQERIDVVKKWPKPESVRDIQVFIGFANFYWHFIKGFSKIAAPRTAILKTTGSSVESASRVDDIEVVSSGDPGRSDVSKKSAKSKSRTKSGNSNDLGKRKLLTSDTREGFNRLRQAFTKATIFRYFDPEYHIRIETDLSGYAIKGVLSQLTPHQVTSDDKIGSNVNWYPVTYFFRKMIPAETQYETHNGELLAIVKTFQT